jgi:hypothetical protein
MLGLANVEGRRNQRSTRGILCQGLVGRPTLWPAMPVAHAAFDCERAMAGRFRLGDKPKAGGNLGPEDMRRKIKFAAADHDRKTRRDLMRELGKRGAKARMLKLGKRERKKIARKASKIAAIKRTKAAAARTQLGSRTDHLSALNEPRIIRP